MSLNNIILPPIVIQQLFTRSLVDYKKEKAAEEKTASKQFAVLGNNRQHIIILIDNEETLYLPDEELNFLFGVLAACNLVMDDIAILNIREGKFGLFDYTGFKIPATKRLECEMTIRAGRIVYDFNGIANPIVVPRRAFAADSARTRARTAQP